MGNSYEFCISIAQIAIQIKPLSNDMKSYCKQYLIPDNSIVQEVIEITETDIEIETKYLQACNAPTYRFNRNILEFDAIHRKVADRLLDHNILLFHASAISINSKAILFSAPSGTGKSTHTQYWKQLYNDNVEIINDDKPLIKCDHNGVFVYGSPWNGKNRLSSNNFAKLDSICILNRGTDNKITRVSQQEIILELFNQIYVPTDINKRQKVLSLLDTILKNSKLYVIYCTDSIESARVVSEELLK